MDDRKTFDLLANPLEGINLIEASAGTGKTFTIAGLFLRLILEKNLLVDEILVVTFTKAATAELNDRIRNLLKEAIEGFARGQSDDEFLNSLIKQYPDPLSSLKRLKEALRDFDEAAIFTIHGFCQRVLKEHAFESSLLFDTELITDEEALKQDIIDDFWRINFYNASPLFIHYALNNHCTPENLLKLVRTFSDKPLLKVIPQITIPDTTQEEKEFNEAFNTARDSWQSSKADVEKILANQTGFKQSAVSKVPELIIGLDYFFNADNKNFTLFDQFELCTLSGVKQATKKNHEPPQHPFFERCEILKEKLEALSCAYTQRLLGLKTSLFTFLHQSLWKQKQKRNVQSFYDLLVKLRNALADKSGAELAKIIRAKYHAALIDEFQDTDPLQYEIFHNIFKNQGRILFLIGDPKQAIYSFRGADIFAYLHAISQVETKFTLKENWRSDPQLINAVNTIFSHVKDPFVFEGIKFQEASAAKNKEADPLIIAGIPEPPLQLWFLDAAKLENNRLTKRGKFIKKSEARELILSAVGAKIVDLLHQGKEKQAFIRQRPIKEQDIAVLVRTNREAVLMQHVLSELKVPSVLYTTGNLFDSREAYELLRILEGIAEPHDEKLIKAALTTDILGIQGEELENLLAHDAEWTACLNKFTEYHARWRMHNFFSMFRYLLFHEKMRVRLVSFSDGERRLTNVLHLAEVLNQEEHQKQLTMGGLTKWLSEQINSGLPRLEEHQLRLETDEYAVKIVTIHKSKGLEYPVVFCPFLWDKSKIKNSNEPFVFHDNAELTLDLGSEHKNENRALAEKEILSENLRLLYVALTRARNCCYMVWGRFHEAGSSAMSYLFHLGEKNDEKNIVDAIETSFNDLTNDQMKEGLKNLETEAQGAIGIHEIPEPVTIGYMPFKEENEKLSLRLFSGHIDRSWKISSFSSLATEKQPLLESQIYSFPELPDYDQKIQSERIPEKEPAGIFAFPRGAKAGSFMHDLFEHLDFTEKDDAVIKTLVAEKLILYGFDISWQETIFDMIKKVLSVPFHPDQKDLTLSSMPASKKVSELEFYFPLQTLSSEKLKNIFLKYGNENLPRDFPEQIENLRFAPARGFMRGFIDLVFQFQDSFYVIDWKSNFLGTNVEDYHHKKLTTVMSEEYYHLQYLLYTVALDKYLSKQVSNYRYEKHFGGVFYLFLRGIDPEKGSAFGIYHTRPSEKLIHGLSQNLITFS